MKDAALMGADGLANNQGVLFSLSCPGTSPHSVFKGLVNYLDSLHSPQQYTFALYIVNHDLDISNKLRHGNHQGEISKIKTR